jgi:hypothetical protein
MFVLSERYRTSILQRRKGVQICFNRSTPWILLNLTPSCQKFWSFELPSPVTSTADVKRAEMMERFGGTQ